jgi:DNA-binding NarL/FixJ family response regulator
VKIEGKMDIKIAIIDQNKIFRESLKVLLEQVPGFHVAISSDTDDCIDSLARESFDVLLLDDCFGQERCRSIIREVRSHNKMLKIIILTLDSERSYPSADVAAVMRKYSEKKDFETTIKNLNT